MTILVTGCAGFIGSVVCEKLVERGLEVVGIDNFNSGYRESVEAGIDFYESMVGDSYSLYCIFKKYKIDTVIHLAAESIIGYSMNDPWRFFYNNVYQGMTLLEMMREANVKNLIFSSTASTYGDPERIPMDEYHPQNPRNSYGESKLIFEKIIKWYGSAYGLKYNIFRFFNVGGATAKHGERRKDETRLIPTLLRCLKNDDTFYLMGTDFKTPDGTAIRDYVHVSDIADAHILALDNLESNPTGIYNLGGDRGYLVSHIIKRTEELYGKELQTVITTPRRESDPDILVATSYKARKELLWSPTKSDIDTIIKDSIDWFRKINL